MHIIFNNIVQFFTRNWCKKFLRAMEADSKTGILKMHCFFLAGEAIFSETGGTAFPRYPGMGTGSVMCKLWGSLSNLLKTMFCSLHRSKKLIVRLETHIAGKFRPRRQNELSPPFVGHQPAVWGEPPGVRPGQRVHFSFGGSRAEHPASLGTAWEGAPRCAGGSRGVEA